MPQIDVGKLVAEIAAQREKGFNARAMQTIGKTPSFSLGDLVKQRVDLGQEPWLRFPSLPKKSGGTAEEDTTPFQTVEAQMLKAGEASPEITKAVRTLEESRARAQTGKTPGKGIWDRVKLGLDDAIETGAQGLTSALDVISRPMYGTTAAIKGGMFGNEERNQGGLNALISGFSEGISGKDREGGYGILDEAGWDTTDKSSWANRLAHGAAGLGIEIAADPLSWMSLGAGAAGREVATELGKAGVTNTLGKQVAKRAARLQRTAKTGAARGTRKFSEGEITDLVSYGLNTQRTKALDAYARAQAKKGGKSFMKDAYDNAIAAGRTPDEAELAAKLALDNETNSLRDALVRGLGESGIGNKAFQLRLGFMGKGKDVLEGSKFAQKAYRPFEWTGEQLGKTGVGDMLGNAFKYEKLFPGRAAEIRHGMTASGVQRQNELNQWVKRTFRGMDRKTREEMVDNIERGIVPTGADRFGTPLAQIQAEVKAKLKQMADEELNAGLRETGDILQDGYVPHMYRGYKANQAAKKAKPGGLSFKDARKQQIKLNQSNVGYTLKDAQKAGLDPETDLAKIILAKGGKQNSALTRHGFQHDLLLTYGQMYKGTVGEAEKWGIQEVPDNLIPKNIKAMLGKDEKWYMPKEFVNTMKQFDNLAKNSTDEHTRAFMRYLDKVNRYFKYSKTITKPAYHVNNMMSDITFNWFDNVPVWEQADTLRRWAATKAGKSGGKWRLSNQHEISWDEMKHLFDTHAGGSNFFDTDVPFRVRGGAGTNKARAAGARANQMLHGFSTKREDFPRFTHFQRAVRDEYKARAGKRVLNTQQHRKILQDSVDAAAARVNKFNIDYSALTPFEQNVMKRVIPFYTYMRKATPLLVESMAYNPGRVLAIDKGRRAIENTLGIEHNEAFDQIRIPEFLRDNHAYLQLNNKQAPSYLSLDALPTNLLASRFGDSTVQGLAKEGVAMANLGIRGPFEIAHGGTFFNNAKPESITDYLLRELNPVEQYLPAGGSKTSANALKKYLGVPNAQISEEQQLQAVKESTDPFQEKNAVLSKMLEEKGYDFQKSTTKKKGTKWRIIDRLTGQLVAEFDSPEAAQAAANNL